MGINDNIKIFVRTAFIFWAINAFQYVNLDGASLPIPSTLFNMIVFLAISIFILHKKDIFHDKVLNP